MLTAESAVLAYSQKISCTKEPIWCMSQNRFWYGLGPGELLAAIDLSQQGPGEFWSAISHHTQFSLRRDAAE
eukprot:COSAG01_NODE_1285_length_10901_cov_5.922514_3_plen_72_part_00